MNIKKIKFLYKGLTFFFSMLVCEVQRQIAMNFKALVFSHSCVLQSLGNF